jgi:hypothetical protein
MKEIDRMTQKQGVSGGAPLLVRYRSGVPGSEVSLEYFVDLLDQC